MSTENKFRRLRLDSIPINKLNKIFDKCEYKNGCRIWTGNTFKRPINKKHLPIYPYMYYKGKVWRGNRLALFLSTGTNPKNLYACHKCDNSLCVNPEHLYWGTPKQNVNDAIDRNRRSSQKITKCPHGHEYSAINTRVANGARFCKTCSWYRNNKMEIKSEQVYL